MARTKITDLKVRRRAAGSPRSGEKKTPNQEDLRRLMLAMNPDAEQIEEAVAAAPRVPETAARLGKGFYEANVEPLLSPIETTKSLINLGREFIQSPVETGKTVAKSELERLKGAGDKPEAAAEYYGSLLSPFSMLRRMPKSEVVRPKSGLVLDYPDAPKVPLKSTDQDLDEAYRTVRFPKGFVNRAIQDGKDAIDISVPIDDVAKRTAIEDFLNTKLKKFYLNQFGTKDDPIFKAIKEGRLYTSELQQPGGIREFLPKAAKEGRSRVNPETGQETFYPSSSAQAALEDISQIYDKMTGMHGSVLVNRAIGRGDYEYLGLQPETASVLAKRDETIQQLIDEGVPPYMINQSTSMIGYKNPRFTKGKLPSQTQLVLGRDNAPTVASMDLKAVQLADPSNFPKSLKTAIEKGQLIYDMEPYGALANILNTRNLVEHLATLPTREIKNLRFEDAIKGSVKAREQILTRENLVKRIREGQAVDPKIFLQGVSQPLLSYGKDSVFPGFTWRQITDPEATAVEGAYIGHSVGGYAKGGGYGPEAHEAFLKGTAKIYTLRDARGRPVTTVEVKDIQGRGPIVTQVKGAGNKSGNAGDKTPYDSLLVDLFNQLNVAGITEADSQLPPLSQAYKKQREAATNVQVRGRVGAPQPVGGAAPAQQGIEQLPVPNAPPQRDPREMLAERFLPAPDAPDQRMMNYLRMLRRRMMEDDDRGPEVED